MGTPLPVSMETIRGLVAAAQVADADESKASSPGEKHVLLSNTLTSILEVIDDYQAGVPQAFKSRFH